MTLAHPSGPMTRTTYLDHNATTPLLPEAAAAMAEAQATAGNASSVHRFGRLARRKIEAAREAVAALAGARPEGVIFTSGGTEANNLALAGTGRKRLLVSAGEHDSVLNAAPGAARIPLTGDGLVAPAALDARLGESSVPALVSIMLANNETGAIQPLAELAKVARAHGALVHCDAIQAAGKLPLDLDTLGIDMMSLSAHKLGGPQGVGALVLAADLEFAPCQRGGGQERGRRAGTENLPGIAGFGAAAQAAVAGLGKAAALGRLRDEHRRFDQPRPGQGNAGRVGDGAEDRIVLARRNQDALSSGTGERQVVGLGAAAGEHHPFRPRAGERGHRLAGRFNLAPDQAAEAVHGGGVAGHRQGLGDGGRGLGPQRRGGIVVEVGRPRHQTGPYDGRRPAAAAPRGTAGPGRLTQPRRWPGRC